MNRIVIIFQASSYIIAEMTDATVVSTSENGKICNLEIKSNKNGNKSSDHDGKEDTNDQIARSNRIEHRNFVYPKVRKSNRFLD